VGGGRWRRDEPERALQGVFAVVRKERARKKTERAAKEMRPHHHQPRPASLVGGTLSCRGALVGCPLRPVQALIFPSFALSRPRANCLALFFIHPSRQPVRTAFPRGPVIMSLPGQAALRMFDRTPEALFSGSWPRSGSRPPPSPSPVLMYRHVR